MCYHWTLCLVVITTVNLFHCTKYLSTPLIFLLFNIFYTSHFFTPSTLIGSASFFFYPYTCSLYCTIQLMFTTGWILIEVGSCNLTALVDITFSIIYEPTYQSTSFLASFSLNTRSFVLNITLSSFFHSSVSLLLLFICLFISFYTFLNATPTSSYIFFILSTNSIAFSTFSFFLISPPILNPLP